MYASHGLVAALLVGVAGWFLWLAVSYTPDPIDPWMVGPALIAIPLVLIDLAAAAFVVFGVRHWATTRRRGVVAAADLGAVGAWYITGLVPPEAVGFVLLAAVVLAGGFVAAAETPRA